jgi:hypothetical protein
MGITVARYGISAEFRKPAAAFVAVSLPLLVNGRFTYQLTTGMDTMLSMLANALVVMGVLQYLTDPRPRRALLLACLAFCAVLARPENLLCAVASPLVAICFKSCPSRRRAAATFVGAFATMYGADQFICYEYFGVQSPLSVLVNHSNSYAGFVTRENALEYAFAGLACMVPFLGILLASVHDSDRRLSYALLLPAALSMGYLITQRQHMGFQGRFFVPFLPYVIVPSLLALDRTSARSKRRAVLGAAIVIPLAIGVFVLSIPLQHYLVRRQVASVAAGAVAVPELRVSSPDPVPSTDWAATIDAMAKLVAGLPSGVVVAAPEVGIVGYASLDKKVIDLVGLNDTDIAVHGFSVDRLLDRAPDIIWFPPPDYTGLRASLFSNSRLLRDYAVIAGAFNYGVAVRRASPYRAAIDAAIAAAWQSLYPQRELQGYRVIGSDSN